MVAIPDEEPEDEFEVAVEVADEVATRMTISVPFSRSRLTAKALHEGELRTAAVEAEEIARVATVEVEEETVGVGKAGVGEETVDVEEAEVGGETSSEEVVEVAEDWTTHDPTQHIVDEEAVTAALVVTTPMARVVGVVMMSALLLLLLLRETNLDLHLQLPRNRCCPSVLQIRHRIVSSNVWICSHSRSTFQVICAASRRLISVTNRLRFWMI